MLIENIRIVFLKTKHSNNEAMIDLFYHQGGGEHIQSHKCTGCAKGYKLINIIIDNIMSLTQEK